MTAYKTYNQRRARRAKKKHRLSSLATAIALFFAVAYALSLYATDKEPQKKNTENLQAQTLCQVIIPGDLKENIIEYTGFTVSFNPEFHQPNYVAWELTATETSGQTKRDSKFKTDFSVPGCATLEDYRKSGYDRGHMAPAADMKWSQEAMSDCHYLTNICPQDHELNGGRWSTLENKCREWALRDSALIIICGPVLSDYMPRIIGNGVSVPERFFKVILSPYTEPMKAIGFIMPNSSSVPQLEALATSVDQIEEITGYDFFSELPDEIETKIESECNLNRWMIRNSKKKK